MYTDLEFYTKKITEQKEFLKDKLNTVYIDGYKYQVKITKGAACKHKDVNEEPSYYCHACEEYLEDDEFDW